MVMGSGPDYRLEGFQPADPASGDEFDVLTLSDDTFTSLAWHHDRDGVASYWIFHDCSATWGLPGAAELVALCVVRDPATRTFRFSYSSEPILPLAQRFLISCGAPSRALEMRQAQRFAQPADQDTTWLERQLRYSHHRYEVLEHYTHGPVSATDGTSIRVLVHDRDMHHAHQPYRLFLETTTPDFSTYTLRQGAFTDQDAVEAWLDRWYADPSTALPDPQALGTSPPSAGTPAVAVPADHPQAPPPGAQHTRRR